MSLGLFYGIDGFFKYILGGFGDRLISYMQLRGARHLINVLSRKLKHQDELQDAKAYLENPSFHFTSDGSHIK